MTKPELHGFTKLEKCKQCGQWPAVLGRKVIHSCGKEFGDGEEYGLARWNSQQGGE